MTDWRTVALGDLLEPIDERAGADGPQHVLSVTEHRGIIPQADVFRKRIATADTSKYKVLRPLDMAYNPYLLWTGAVGQWLGVESGVTSPVYECFRARSPHHPRFVGLLLESGILTGYFDSTAIGSIKRRRRTTVPVFLEAQVSVPKPAEQRRIVDLITTLDANLTGLESEIVQSANLHVALREHLMSGPTRPLDDVLDGIDAGRSPWTDGKAPSTTEPGVLKVSAVTPLEFRASESKRLPADHGLSPMYEVRPGDLLITRANTPDRVGAACVVPLGTRAGLFLCDKTLRLRPSDGMDADYLAEALNLRAARSHLTSSSTGTSKSMYNVSQAAIRGTPIPLAEADDQREVSAVLEAAREWRMALRAEREQLRRFRSAVLSSLLSCRFTIPKAYDRLRDSA